jgi:hypothetical protein
VDSKYFPQFGIDDNSPWNLRADESAITYIFSDYKGGIVLSGFKKLPWHEWLISEKRLQVVPRILRKLPADYNLFDSILVKLLLFLGILEK